MTKACESVVVVTQRRHGRAFSALQVAPKRRPSALRDLYLDAGSLIRHATPPVTTATTSRSDSK